MSDDFEITELNRRLANLIRLGKVEEIDLAAARVKVRIGELLTAPLPWLTQKAGADKSWWAPEVGEQIVVFSPSGDPAQGVVLGAIFQQAFPPPEASARKLYQEVGNGADIKTPTRTIIGDLMVMGNVTVTGDMEVSGKVSQGGGVGSPNGVVTGECICHFSGSPHGDISVNVEASK